MFGFFPWVYLEQSDSDMPLHMPIQFQGYYVWLVKGHVSTIQICAQITEYTVGLR